MLLLWNMGRCLGIMLPCLAVCHHINHVVLRCQIASEDWSEKSIIHQQDLHHAPAMRRAFGF